MNWEALGVIAEIIGAAAVVLSLGYLAVQIGQQNKESRRATTLTLTEQWNDFMAPLVNLSDMNEIFVRGIAGGSLSEEETCRFWSFMARYFRIVESLYLHHIDGLLDPRIWIGVQRNLDDVLSNPGVHRYWEHRSHWFSNEFIEYVSGCLSGERQGSTMTYPQIGEG
jgi:hypothetical protein